MIDDLFNISEIDIFDRHLYLTYQLHRYLFSFLLIIIK